MERRESVKGYVAKKKKGDERCHAVKPCLFASLSLSSLSSFVDVVALERKDGAGGAEEKARQSLQVVVGVRRIKSG